MAACKPLPKDQAHFQKGYEAYEKGDFYTALLYLKPLVEEGHPAAELLMAKMYANGQGVKEDEGKAELLRNLAAAKIYSRPLPPGVVRPANATLKAVQDRLDYYADGNAAGKAPPVQDLSQLLMTLDLKSIRQLANTDFENSSSPSQTPAEPAQEASQGESNLSPPEAAPEQPQKTPAEASSAPAPITESVELAGARGSQHISLSILRQSAMDNDPLAMQLLSVAYAKGYYGLPVNSKQAALWRQKARDARGNSNVASSEPVEPDESLPIGQLTAVVAAGLLLVGSGVWLRARRRTR
jgi:TPR repeat protein